jgi:aldehyde:ferredoxin oxidoreductase
MDCFEFDDAMKAGEGEKISTTAIGQAGEKLVKFACVMNDGKRGRAAARCGFGALMGFKKLKGIVVRSAGAVKVRDKEALKVSVDQYFPKIKMTHEVRKIKGRELWQSLWQMGRAPIKNWTTGEFEAVDDTIVDVLSESAKYDFCYGCRTSCVESRLKPDGRRHTVWEALCPIGTQCLIHDYEKVHQAYDLWNQYGLDSISTGAVIAFAIECKENGIIKTDKRLSPYQTEGQGRLTAKAQDFTCLLNSLTLCLFTNSTDCFGRPPLQPPSYIDFLNIITGWDIDMDEFYDMGERIFNLQRMISMRRGVKGTDDNLPDRFLKEKRAAGPAGENLPDLKTMLQEYYAVRGWGANGSPTKERLKMLKLTECNIGNE